LHEFAAECGFASGCSAEVEEGASGLRIAEQAGKALRRVLYGEQALFDGGFITGELR